MGGGPPAHAGHTPGLQPAVGVPPRGCPPGLEEAAETSQRPPLLNHTGVSLLNLLLFNPG